VPRLGGCRLEPVVISRLVDLRRVSSFGHSLRANRKIVPASRRPSLTLNAAADDDFVAQSSARPRSDSTPMCAWHAEGLAAGSRTCRGPVASSDRVTENASISTMRVLPSRSHRTACKASAGRRERLVSVSFFDLAGLWEGSA
jgi:hypothetical protein